MLLSKAIQIFEVKPWKLTSNYDWWKKFLTLDTKNIDKCFQKLLDIFLQRSVLHIDNRYEPEEFNRIKNKLIQNGLKSRHFKNLNGLISAWDIEPEKRLRKRLRKNENNGDDESTETDDINRNKSASKRRLLPGIVILLILMITYLIIYVV